MAAEPPAKMAAVGCGDNQQDGRHSGAGAGQGLGSRWPTPVVAKMATVLHGTAAAVRLSSRWPPGGRPRWLTLVG